MRILFISRSTLFTQPGGDTVQIEQTALYLEKMGLTVEIQTDGFRADYQEFDVLHFFNLNRPADVLPYLKSKKHPPLVVTSIYIDYSSVPERMQLGPAGLLNKYVGPSAQEYIKTLARGLKGTDRMPERKFLLEGYKKSVQTVLNECQHLVTASSFELTQLKTNFAYNGEYSRINLGCEHALADVSDSAAKSGKEVLCVARFEALKNQLTLVRAHKLGSFSLTLIGQAAKNQKAYFERCKEEASDEVVFLPFTKGPALGEAYKKASVHVLPSFYETTGLVTVEALLNNCQVVCGKGGAQAELFDGVAHFCDVESPHSINEAIEKALEHHQEHTAWVMQKFSWKKAALELSDIYKNLTP
jgi:glycosyltransferase involved in cell wall biosynthesis